MEKAREWKRVSVGDAAVEGLVYGIAAGVAMLAFILLVEWWVGVAPAAVLSYFDAGGNASALAGLFTHVAVSGIYGVGFGIAAMMVGRMAGARMSLSLWLALGILLGALLFAIAEWIVLPRTNSLLREMPTWALATAHFLYGLVLAWLMGRHRL